MARPVTACRAPQTNIAGEDAFDALAGFEQQGAIRIGAQAAPGQIGFLASQRLDGKLILPEAIKVLQQKA